MALNVKAILGLLAIINIVTVLYFYSKSTDTVSSSAEFNPGPKRREYDNLKKSPNQSALHKNSAQPQTDVDNSPDSDDFDNNDIQDDHQIDSQDDVQIVQGDNIGLTTDDALNPDDNFHDKDDSKDIKDDQPDDFFDQTDHQPSVDNAGTTDDKDSDFLVQLPKEDKLPGSDGSKAEDKTAKLNDSDTSVSSNHQNNPENAFKNDEIDIDALKSILIGNDDDDTTSQVGLFNPFRELGYYKAVGLEHFNQEPGSKPYYNNPHTGLNINSSYCDYNDLFNIRNPSNLMDQMHFVTDYDRGLARVLVMEKIGIDVMPQVSVAMKGFREALFDLDLRATMFFTKKVDFHFFHEVGRQFLCVSQMYNHIPGHGVITRKDFLVGSVNAYSDYYSQKPKCFNKKTFFPYAYRLNNVTECNQFFEEINAASYFITKEKIRLNYLIKVGYNAHRASGVFLFDESKEQETRSKYQNGSLCGNVEDPLLAQKYIGNPLLLDRHNKFDFRMYMLIASVDPLIIYYHDGFLRVSLETYDQNSTDVNVHLTNTHLSKQKFKDIKNEALEAEMREYQMWTLSRLQEYLLKTEKITDPNWLDNYLRPIFQKAYIHLIKMSHHAFYKHSSVFEMFGIDFMLDDDLGLWLIEVNGSPQLIGTNPTKEKLMVELVSDLFEIQYSYLRSKMKRLRRILHKIIVESNGPHTFDINAYKEEFSRANKNFLEPEWQIRKNISWHKILDENIPGKKAYMGILEDECILDK